MKVYFTILFIVGFVFLASSQNDSIDLKFDKSQEIASFKANPYDANAPAKAAFYSAILPGLGQAYNGSYWKIPLAYLAIGTPMYFYIDNNNEYNRYRDAYKRRLAGFEDDEFAGILTESDLIDAQKLFRENRDLSLLLTILGYVLNIVDANVEAHLNQFSISDDLSMQIQPSQIQSVFNNQNTFGLSFNLKLK